jgi:hypothetical protein
MAGQVIQELLDLSDLVVLVPHNVNALTREMAIDISLV